jgi:hypothetical protein
VYASDHQRIQLVHEIAFNALILVQDPYGNYVRDPVVTVGEVLIAGHQVIQYVLDLYDTRFSDRVIRQFTGNICALSVQKYSSNVIEKVSVSSALTLTSHHYNSSLQSIRVANLNTRRMLIEELLNRGRLEKLLQDWYGNYCVQVFGNPLRFVSILRWSLDSFGLCRANTTDNTDGNHSPIPSFDLQHSCR